MKRAYYQEQYNTFNNEMIKVNKQSQLISLIRFIIFILFGASLIITFYDQKLLFLIPSIICFGIFLYLIVLHNKIEWQLNKLKASLAITEDYLKRFDYQWQDLANSELFVEEAGFIGKDLDLFGKNSLFQYLSLAKSKQGQAQLFAALTSNKLSNNTAAIHELALKQDLHLKLASYIRMYDSAKSDLVLNDNNLLTNNERFIYQILANVYPIIILIMLLLVSLNILPLTYLIIMLLVNALIILVRYKYNAKFLASILKNHDNLNVVVNVINELETEDFNCDKLKTIKATLTNDFKASNSIKKLVKLKERLESQANALVYLLAELFLMWDYRNVLYFDKWKQSYGKDAEQYLEIFYEIEMMLSLGVVEQTKKIVCLPNIATSKTPYLMAKDLYHPLLNSASVVGNDFNGPSQTTLITGSNMSGKTTFIRSVGINLILAYAGAAVCAKEFDVSLMKIFTSIRVEDNLNDGISTFYAEIKRIKEMVEYEKQEQPMLCLIDEIFKGTNSEDRIYGAQKAIEQLTNNHCLTFVSTHDAKLCELPKIVNYHFKEYYENDELKFDYKINEGISQTRNAQYLLKIAGIIVD